MMAPEGDGFHFFDAIGDETRRKIVELLFNNEMHVNELTSHVYASRPSVSYHLRILREANVVVPRKRSTKTFYSVNPEVIQNMCQNYMDKYCGIKKSKKESKEESVN